MKKLIINALGIVSVMTMLIMAVVKVGWSEKSDEIQFSDSGDKSNEIKGPENNLALMCDRIDHLSDNVRDIRPQSTYIRSEPDNSSKCNRRQFDESLFEDSYSYDPTDYPNEDSYNVPKVNSNSNDKKKAKPPDIIE